MAKNFGTMQRLPFYNVWSKAPMNFQNTKVRINYSSLLISFQASNPSRLVMFLVPLNKQKFMYESYFSTNISVIFIEHVLRATSQTACLHFNDFISTYRVNCPTILLQIKMQALGSKTIFSRSAAKGIIWNSNQYLQLRSFLFATVMLPSVQLTLSVERMPAASEQYCLFTIIPLPSLGQLQEMCMVIIDMAYELLFFKITSLVVLLRHS